MRVRLSLQYYLINRKPAALSAGFAIFCILSFIWQSPAFAQRYTPPAFCAITNNSAYESLTLPIAIGGDYPSGSTQTINFIVGDTQAPGAPQASTGDIENLIVFLDTDADGDGENSGAGVCNYDQGAGPAGCNTNVSVSIPTVTHDTTFRGRVMLSYNNTTPANGCGANSFGDTEDFLLVANVQEFITIEDVSGIEDNGAITLTATLSHQVSDGAGLAAFTVQYTLSDGTATLADSDYIGATGTLNFTGAAGETVTFTVMPVVDTNDESDETFTVSLLNLSNLTHGIDISDTATVTIIDDDEEVDLGITKTVSDANPDIGDVVVFTLSVTNTGISDAVNASVQDIVPAGFGSVTAISAPVGSTLSVSGNTVDWTGLDIPIGNTLVATFSAVVLAP